MAPATILAIDDSPTILKVLELVLGKAGYRVHVASDGADGLRLAAEFRPDLILLDFVMPKMNGYQVCRTLADDPALARIPVVLMSAKGDQVGERFVQQMGVVDYITKPFSPEALTAVVAHSLERRPARIGPVDPIEEMETVAVPLLEPEDSAAAPRFKGTIPPAPPNPRAVLRDVIVSAVATGPGDELAARLRERLSDKVLDRVAAGAEAAGCALAGNLALVPLAEVLGLLDQQRQSGVLAIQRGDRHVAVSFRGGRIDFATAEGLGEELRLGHFLVAGELVSRDQLEGFFRARGGSGLFGEELVKLGAIGEEDLRQALGRQTRERIFEALRWHEGRFAFHAGIDPGPAAARAGLQLGVAAILLEGSRRIDEWRLIEREIDDFDAVFLREEERLRQLGPDRLGHDEQAVLDLVNGRNSVRDVIRLGELGTFEASQILFRLRTAGLIRRRVEPVAV